VWLTDRSISKSFLCHHCVVLYTVYVFYVRTAPVRSQHVAPRCTLHNSRPKSLLRLLLPIPTPLKLALLAQLAPCLFSSSSSLLCCYFCCRPAAAGTPYERRQNGWLHAETTGDYKRRCRIVTNKDLIRSLIVQHVQFFLGPTDVQPVAICLIWCRVVQSRDVRSRVFSRHPNYLQYTPANDTVHFDIIGIQF